MSLTRQSILVLGASLSLALAGCAEPSRTHVSAPILAESPTPQTVFGEATLTSEGNPRAEINIPSTPDHPLTLNECIDLAKRVSPSLDNADQSRMGAMWTRWQAITAFLPTGSTNYTATRYNDMTQTGRDRVPGMTGRTQYSWNGQASQSLFAGGKNVANLLLSQLGVSATDIQKIQAREDLLLSVKQSYYSILATQKALAVAKTTVVNLQSHLNVAQSFFDVGMVPKNQVLEAEVELAKAVQAQTSLNRDLVVAKARLNILLRQPVENEIAIVDILKYTPFPLTMNQCLETGLADSPELHLGRTQVDVAAKNIDVARSGLYPHVDMVYTHTALGNTPGVNGGWAANGNDSGWQLAAMATFNFWEWGRTKAEVEKTKVELNRSINNLTSLEDNTKLEVTTNYQNLLSAGKNIDVSAKAVVAAAEDLRMVNERYLEQVATSTEVLDAQTRYSNAQYDHYEALYNYNLAWATLERSLGRQVLPSGLAASAGM